MKDIKPPPVQGDLQTPIRVNEKKSQIGHVTVALLKRKNKELYGEKKHYQRSNNKTIYDFSTETMEIEDNRIKYSSAE